MSTLKKILALSLALAMILSVSVFAGNYSADTYKDAAAIDKDAAESVELLYALKVMTGDEKGNFNPNATITRAEVAKMIYVILNYGKDDKAVNYAAANLFTDVPATEWYAGYINYLAAMGLVNGSEGKFYPTNPVKTAEAAKMLLTAIGYNATDRQYVGANWAKNVLSDASIVGLLAGYKADINGAAPRQWVAVMFSNALLEAFTYKTVYPAGFNGIFNTAASGANFVKFGYKYYGLETFTGYLFATAGAYIDTTERNTNTASSGKVIFATEHNAKNTPDETQWIQVKNPGLGYMDLGQEFRVIYKDGGSTVYSACLTGESVVADAEVKDIKVANTQATYKNDANNKYIFTIGEMEAKFDSSKISALEIKYDSNAANLVVTKEQKYNVTELKTAAGKLKTDLYRAIDKDGDGDIDYMIIVEYTYAHVNNVAEHKSYGEYFTATKVGGGDLIPVGFNSGTSDKRWYLDDAVNTEDEIVKNNVLKISYNPDNGKYDVEALTVVSDVTYEKRTTGGVHTLGGEEYQVAANGFEFIEKFLVSKNLKDNMDIAIDGSLVVEAGLVDSNYDNLDDINAQLVMVTGAYVDVYNNPSYNRYFINYMTIDGEMHKEAPMLQSKSGIQVVTYSDLTGKDYNNAPVSGSPAYLENHQRLFVLRESGDSVYLIKLTETYYNAQGSLIGNAKDILDYSDSLLDGYHEGNGVLDTQNNEFNHDYIAADNAFFVSYMSGKTEKFAVMTLDDMGEGVDKDAYIQGLFETKRSYNNYLAGYIFVNLSLNESNGYLYTTSGEAYDIDDDEWYLTDVVFSDGPAEKDIQVSEVNGVALNEANPVKANCLYSYTYEKVNGEKVYKLKLINEKTEDGSAGNRCDFTYDTTTVSDPDTKYEITNAYVANGDEILVADHSAAGREKLILASDCKVVLKKVVLDRDQNQTGGKDNLHFSVTEEISFVDFDVLVKNEDADSELLFSIYNGEADSNYDYFSDYYYVGGEKNVKTGAVEGVKMLYVITYSVEDAAQATSNH